MTAESHPPSSALGEEIRKLAREWLERAVKAIPAQDGFNLARGVVAVDAHELKTLCNAVLGEGK